MKPEILAAAITMLEARYTLRGKGAEFAQSEPLFEIAMRNLPDREGMAAVQYLLATSKYLPELPDIINETAARCSELPAAGRLWAEFWHKLNFAGYKKPNWTHEILTETVEILGGWSYLYGRTQWDEEKTRTRFDKAFIEAAAAWKRATVENLLLPPAQQDKKYLSARPAALFIAPPPAREVAPGPPLRLSEIRNAPGIPAEIKAKFDAIFPERGKRRVAEQKYAETAQRREAINAELEAYRAAKVSRPAGKGLERAVPG